MNQQRVTLILFVVVIFEIVALSLANPFKAVKKVSAPDSSQNFTLQSNIHSNAKKQSCSFFEAFHSPSQKCYETGSQGPCNEYERWFAKSENDTEGECSCFTSSKSCGNIVNQPIARSVKDERCYPVFTKADCKNENEWFTFLPNSVHMGHCTPNPCANMSLKGTVQLNETTIVRLLGMGFYEPGEPYQFNRDLLPIKPFWFLHNNKCVHTFTLGTCTIPGNKNPHTLAFKGTKPVPECIDAIGPVRCLIPVVLGLPEKENMCPLNYRKVGKDCVYNVMITPENDYEN